MMMSSNRDPMKQVEGQWDEVIRQADEFVGRRVRVTVLPDEAGAASSMLSEIHRWLAEGDALEIFHRSNVKPGDFGDILVEKFRKQGLVL
jgi:hypothetical protein